MVVYLFTLLGIISGHLLYEIYAPRKITENEIYLKNYFFKKIKYNLANISIKFCLPIRKKRIDSTSQSNIFKDTFIICFLHKMIIFYIQ